VARKGFIAAKAWVVNEIIVIGIKDVLVKNMQNLQIDALNPFLRRLG